MSFCLTPGCFEPHNPDSNQFCLCCGSKLLLKERYRPLQQIGQGGFGRTFLGVDEHIPAQPVCVIKQLFLQNHNSLILQKAMQLFHQEAEHLQELGEHQQIPTLLAHFEQNKQLYLVQEQIEGETLAEELRQQGVFTEKQIWQLLQELLPVLKFIHDRQVIHRDIKPQNIIRRRSDGKPVLIDFGVAKLISDTALLRTGTVVGTAEYLAPEQSKGKAFPASDLYSLGVTCIHLLTNVSPFDLFDIVNNRWAWRNYLPSGIVVSDRLGRILDNLLEIAVSQRYQTTGEVLQALTVKTEVATTTKSLPAEINFFTKFWQRSTGKLTEDNLTSAVGVDYSKLRNLLATGKWQQADHETWVVLCQATGKLPGHYLQASDVDQLPCQDLQTIDQLWVKYSQNRFGFSVQKQIYEQAAGGEYDVFCEYVGWPTYRPQVLDTLLKFSLKAPAGHLPSRRWIGGYCWWRHARRIAAKLEECGIN